MQFTWTRRSNGSWGVRIPDGTQLPDDGIVTVISRDGRKQEVHIIAIVDSYPKFGYSVASWEPADDYRAEQEREADYRRGDEAAKRLLRAHRKDLSGQVITLHIKLKTARDHRNGRELARLATELERLAAELSEVQQA